MKKQPVLVQRINASLPKQDNSYLCKDSDITNVKIIETTDGGETVTSAHIDIVYLDATGTYENANGLLLLSFGVEPRRLPKSRHMPKFVVYPLTHNGTPDSPVKVRLQYFGDNYDEPGTDDFPAGYTIRVDFVPEYISRRLASPTILRQAILQ